MISFLNQFLISQQPRNNKIRKGTVNTYMFFPMIIVSLSPSYLLLRTQTLLIDTTKEIDNLFSYLCLCVYLFLGSNLIRLPYLVLSKLHALFFILDNIFCIFSFM